MAFNHEEKKMSVIEIGCCGAYCKTCPESKNSRCRGCKIGYENGERDITKAKCKMKVCCMTKDLNTCADCDIYSSCEVIQDFYRKKNYKYSQYKEATLFIRDKGYNIFLEIAAGWKRQYGKYK
jgi:hypothetical protein